MVMSCGSVWACGNRGVSDAVRAGGAERSKGLRIRPFHVGLDSPSMRRRARLIRRVTATRGVARRAPRGEGTLILIFRQLW